MNIKEIAKHHGFSVAYSEPEQCKTRFVYKEAKDVQKTVFVDVWDGKKGVTVATYSPRTKQLKYKKHLSATQLHGVFANARQQAKEFDADVLIVNGNEYHFEQKKGFWGKLKNTFKMIRKVW